MPASLDVPYERQANTLSRRMCGAAALAMVYRSLGLECSQEELWPDIALPPGDGEACARTYLLGADALRRGFAALTVQARYALPLLRTALDRQVRVIVNHRQNLNSLAGHYSVVVAVDDEAVLLHDPLLGPVQPFEHAEWLKLWRPGPINREVAGNLAVYITARSDEPARCGLCNREVPPAVPCPSCRLDIPLQPSVLLGCLDGNCPRRMWELLFCPSCDAELGRLA